MIITTGYLSLFLFSFLAATIVPFSSEVVFVSMLMTGLDPLTCFILATSGNWLGGLTSFWIGHLGKMVWIEKYLKISHEKTERFKNFITGKETWIAFFCWLPFVGDVIAVVLGLVRANFWHVSIGMLVGKGARYAFLTFATIYAWSLF